ncbi:HET-domain-containing protein [Hypoxylon sp. NC0597]|nr:HET-domain-containing protein [Hypoxylon sp. NC0597]
MAQSLCDVCRNITFATSSSRADNSYTTWKYSFRSQTFSNTDVPQTDRRILSYPLYGSVASLMASSSNGCPLCTLITDILLYSTFATRMHPMGKARQVPDVPVELLWYPNVGSRYQSSAGGCHRFLAARLVTDTMTTSAFQVPLFFTKYNSEALCSTLSSKAVTNHFYTGSEENFILANFWLKRCLSSHSRCTIIAYSFPALPTRVLDVGKEGEPLKLRLVDGKSRVGQYITLSHCWGKLKIITTTKSNLTQHESIISFNSLSKTFQHAVIATRALSVRYLWIDSLCIIQDSIDDWTSEASKMGQYYSQSLVTISAVSAKGGEDGMFAVIDSRVVSPMPIDITFPDSKESGFVHSLYPADDSRLIWGDTKAPLWDRGWVLQERTLPTRMLMFSKYQMSWQCQEEMGSENIPEGRVRESSQEETDIRFSLVGSQINPLAAQSTSHASLISRKLHSEFYGDQVSRHRLYCAWYNTVEQYTYCKLTRPSDIFEAIDGIRLALQYALDDEYVAGIWKRDIHRGLLWIVDEEHGPNRGLPLRHRRSPSWSWAAVPGACKFKTKNASPEDFDKSRLQINVIHFGQRIALKVHGVLRRAINIEGDNGLTESTHRQGSLGENLIDQKSGHILGNFIADSTESTALTEVWCLCVGLNMQISRRINPKRDEIFYSLLPDCLKGWMKAKEIEERLALRKLVEKFEVYVLVLACLNKEEQIFMRIGVGQIRNHLKCYQNSKPQSLTII